MPMAEHSHYLAGFAERDASAHEVGIQLMGWGIPANVAERVEAPLKARCVVTHEPRSSTNFVYVCVDCCVITHLMRERAVARAIARLQARASTRTLGITDDQIMVTATHTHSSPAGVTDYLFYSLSGPGFSESTVDAVAQSIADAIVAAAEDLEPVDVRVGRADVPEDVPIAFNRSMHAWARNPEAAPGTTRAQAVNRTMTVLRFDAPNGAPRGLLSFFGTHCTTVHSDNRFIHPDHKGLASDAFRRAMKSRGADDRFQAIFGQETAGDVTPNYRPSRTRGFYIGHCDDDLESAAFVAEKQVEVALEAWESAGAGEPLAVEPIFSRLDQSDLSDRAVAPSFAGEADVRTAGPVIGIAFMEGTHEGPGPLLPVRKTSRLLTRAKHALQDTIAGFRPELANRRFPQRNKISFLDLGGGINGHAFHFFSLRKPRKLPFEEPVVARYQYFLQNGGVDDGPWTPRVTSSQLARIGHVYILGVSGEPTTVAGQRLRRTIASVVNDDSAVIVIHGYANSYNSYIATPEEFDAQEYEGASTLFGRYTLPAYQQNAAALAAATLAAATREHSAGPGRRDPRWRTATATLAARAFQRLRSAGVP